MYSEASLHKEPSSAEEALKLAAAFPQSRDYYDKSLYVESARRVVFRNCMEKCELDDSTLPNFNKNFYYNQKEAQACISSCFNFRMQAHFGPAAATTDGLQMDLDAMKREYQRYETWHPASVKRDRFAQGFQEAEVQEIVSRIQDKSARETRGRFDFQ